MVALRQPRVMGILNVTPDSFYQKSRVRSIDAILARAWEMINEGAWCLDVGGYSSRPGATDIPIDEEIKRVLEPIQELRKAFPEVIISIDTFRSKVAEVAMEAGANIINDISAGHLDERMFDLVADLKVPYIGMHMKGTPQDMKKKANYEDLVGEMIKYFAEVKDELYRRGLSDFIIDPGFGFAKNLDQNYELLSKLSQLKQIIDCPMLVGVSRKSMIFKLLDINPDQSLNGTSVLNTIALQQGADILRVHDVREAVEAIRLTQKIKESL